VLKVKKEYVNSFRLALERRTIDISDPNININDAAVFESFKKVLEGDNERQILYVLKLVGREIGGKFDPFLEKLIDHSSPEVKAHVLDISKSNSGIDFTEKAEELIQHENEEVRFNAFSYLYFKSDNKISTLESFLNYSELDILLTALRFMGVQYRKSTSIRKKLDFMQLFENFYNDTMTGRTSGNDQNKVKIGIAKIIGASDYQPLYAYLFEILNDTSNEVVRAAVRGAGQCRSEEFLPKLFDLLSVRGIRQAARFAIAEYGDEIIEALLKKLSNQQSSHSVKLEVIKILDRIGTKKSAMALLDNLNQENTELSYEIYKAILHVRTKLPDLTFPRRKIEKHIVRESENYYRLLSVIDQHQRIVDEMKTAHDDRDSIIRASEFLKKAIYEKLDANMERIFRLLALRFSPPDIYNAWLGIRSNDPDRLSNAIEYLDSILDPKLRMYLVPILEKKSIQELTRNLSHLHGPSISSAEDYREILLGGSDIWLKVTTLYLIAESGQVEWSKIVSEFTEDQLPIIKETAEYALKKLSVEKIN